MRGKIVLRNIAILATMLQWLLFPFLVRAENHGADTLNLKRGQILVTSTYKLKIDQDTTIILNDSVDFVIVRDGAKGERLFSQLRTQAAKKGFTREVYSWMVRSTNHAVKPNEGEVTSKEDQLAPFSGRPIRSIRYIQDPVFSITPSDTSNAQKELKMWGNRLHMNTRQYILKNNTLLKKGEPFDPYAAVENEQFLRNLPFIADAQIWAIAAKNSDSVDVIITTRDVWSTAFQFEVSNSQKGQFSVYDRNIGGLGHEFQATVLYDYKASSNTGFDGDYKINNTFGKFINGDVNYHNAFGDKYLSLSATRAFNQTRLKYAGGISYVIRTQPIYIFDFDSIYVVQSQVKDGWVGRSFVLNRGTKFTHYKQQLTFATRLTNYTFGSRPPTDKTYNPEFHDRTILLGGITISSQRFFQNSLIYGYGKTEDISQGFKLELTGGYEIGEYNERTYLGAIFSMGKLYSLGYNMLKFSIGSYIRRGNPEQGTARVDFRQFSNLWQLGTFKMRQFLNVAYTQGFNRFYGEGETILLSSNDGIRGLRIPDISGTKRLNINAEVVFFTPYAPMDFHVALYTFFDMGTLGHASQNIFDGALYSGFGIGVRMRNENLVFRILQIQLAFYPRLPIGSIPSYINISGIQGSRFENFYPTPPDQVKFQ